MSGSNAPLLSANGVTLRWPGQETPLFSRFSIGVNEGEFLVVAGPSGCGKTTLLHLLGSFLSPEEGRIVYRGKPISRPDPSRLLMFQGDDQLFPWRTALGNVFFGVHYSTPPNVGKRSDHRRRAERALREVGLSEAMNRYPHTLSGGMRQRVALARAFASYAPLLLLDEPFAAVDAPTRRQLGTLLSHLQRDHRRTVVFVTHDLDEAVRLATRVVVLDSTGRISYQRSIDTDQRQDEWWRAGVVSELERHVR